MLTDSLMTGRRTTHLFTGDSDHPGRSDQAQRTLEEEGVGERGEAEQKRRYVSSGRVSVIRRPLPQPVVTPGMREVRLWKETALKRENSAAANQRPITFDAWLFFFFLKKESI